MTRLEILKQEKEKIKGFRCLAFSLMDRCIEWYDREIEAIEIHGAKNEEYKDEPTTDDLGKIRAEIESQLCGNGNFNDGIDRALEIIDKYKGARK